MKYLIGSGYSPHKTSVWFYPLWLDNTLRYAEPDQVVVVAHSRAPCPNQHHLVQWLAMRGDLGHVYDLLSKRKNYEWCGWSMTICITALLAYFNECDYIHKEQDALAFGPWVERIYEEAGNDLDVLFGSVEGAASAQSMFWVRHSFIPEFVRLYLGTGDERKVENIGEAKFDRLWRKHERFGRYTFGYDRQRPMNLDDRVFYGQKFTPQELMELEKKGFLSLKRPIPQVDQFTGDPKTW